MKQNRRTVPRVIRRAPGCIFRARFRGWCSTCTVGSFFFLWPFFRNETGKKESQPEPLDSVNRKFALIGILLSEMLVLHSMGKSAPLGLRNAIDECYSTGSSPVRYKYCTCRADTLWGARCRTLSNISSQARVSS